MQVYNENVRQLKEIEFSLISPDEIIERSVAEITKQDTYVNKEPVMNGVFDPRMGILENGRLCPTDEHDVIKCPGFFGHIVMVKPVFYVQFMKSIVDTLNLVCYRCGALLINDSVSSVTLQKIHKLTRKSKRRIEISKLVMNCKMTTCPKCEVLQPSKYSRPDLTISANFKSSKTSNSRVFNMTPEYIIHLFKKITDNDCELLGFNAKKCRPEWMICSVLPISPPVVRPSVISDTSQRSEDDLTHKYVDIIKANKDLKKKVDNDADKETIEIYRSILQYHVATLIDNDISNINPAAQRTGRPIKAIRQRLKSKEGRIRGNLMGKRVDYSARTVITPDPLLKLDELGVPLEICMNLTFPETVTKDNYEFMQKLVRNGPSKYPGAKSLLIKSENSFIYLKYSNLEIRANKLKIGDIVSRHLLRNDNVLFNRQPTLHKMSMMNHRVVPMPGRTFRLCVDVTTPYNADFDGDEMNMHVPQNYETLNELSVLTNVSHNLISPSSGKPVIGIVQDGLVGAYMITDDDYAFSNRHSMNLAMWNKNANLFRTTLSYIMENKDKAYFTGKEVVSNALNKNLTINLAKGCNLKIQKGNFLQGNLSKDTIKKISCGLVHVCTKDLGPYEAKDMIDNIRNIVTNYILLKGFSVGISDMMIDDDLQTKNEKMLNEHLVSMNKVCSDVHDREKECISLKEFENRISSQKIVDIMGKATREGMKTNKNRLVKMVNSGSKGSDLNISQIIACVGQQSVDGARISYGYQNRTLPHFVKFDQSPQARGFVKNSFMKGLNPTEFFFHAMGGREGLIDTAVKTSTTGYIQRRLMKLLEDVKIAYDGTVRDGSNKLVQMRYGEDNMESTRSESVEVPFKVRPPVNLRHSVESICGFSLEKDIFPYQNEETKNETLNTQTQVEEEYKGIANRLVTFLKKWIERSDKEYIYTKLMFPIHFERILHRFENAGESDLTLIYLYQRLNDVMKIVTETPNYDPEEDAPVCFIPYMMLYGYMTPKTLFAKRVTKSMLDDIIALIYRNFQLSRVEYGEMVGVISAQSIGEPATQLTLNTFHAAGNAERSAATRGVPRINELLGLTKNPKSQNLTIYLKEKYRFDKENVNKIKNSLEYKLLSDIVNQTTIKYSKTQGWILSIQILKSTLLDFDISPMDIYLKLMVIRIYNMNISYNFMNDDLAHIDYCITSIDTPHIEDGIKKLRSLQKNVLNKIIIKGVYMLQTLSISKKEFNYLEDDELKSKKEYTLFSSGSDLKFSFLHPYIDNTRTISNDVWEVYNILGIEAAKTCLFNEIIDVISDSTYVNPKHVYLLVDMMTQSGILTSVDRHGFSRGDIGPLAKCSFEETDVHLCFAAIFNEKDYLKGVSSNIMLGQNAPCGTGIVEVMLDQEMLNNMTNQKILDMESTNLTVKEEATAFIKRLEQTQSNVILKVKEEEEAVDYQEMDSQIDNAFNFNF